MNPRMPLNELAIEQRRWADGMIGEFHRIVDRSGWWWRRRPRSGPLADYLAAAVGRNAESHSGNG